MILRTWIFASTGLAVIKNNPLTIIRDHHALKLSKYIILAKYNINTIQTRRLVDEFTILYYVRIQLSGQRTFSSTNILPQIRVTATTATAVTELTKSDTYRAAITSIYNRSGAEYITDFFFLYEFNLREQQLSVRHLG